MQPPAACMCAEYIYTYIYICYKYKYINIHLFIYLVSYLFVCMYAYLFTCLFPPKYVNMGITWVRFKARWRLVGPNFSQRSGVILASQQWQPARAFTATNIAVVNPPGLLPLCAYSCQVQHCDFRPQSCCCATRNRMPL